MLDNMIENLEQQSKDSLKVTALTQRVASLVAQYEEQMADFRAQATINQNNMQMTIDSLKNQNEALQTQLQELRDPEPTATEAVESVPQEDD